MRRGARHSAPPDPTDRRQITGGSGVPLREFRPRGSLHGAPPAVRARAPHARSSSGRTSTGQARATRRRTTPTPAWSPPRGRAPDRADRAADRTRFQAVPAAGASSRRTRIRASSLVPHGDPLALVASLAGGPGATMRGPRRLIGRTATVGVAGSADKAPTGDDCAARSCQSATEQRDQRRSPWPARRRTARTPALRARPRSSDRPCRASARGSRAGSAVRRRPARGRPRR